MLIRQMVIDLLFHLPTVSDPFYASCMSSIIHLTSCILGTVEPEPTRYIIDLPMAHGPCFMTHELRMGASQYRYPLISNTSYPILNKPYSIKNFDIE